MQKCHYLQPYSSAIYSEAPPFSTLFISYI
nr:MAG TPA: hypothetical protein [Caudoviricetes sp.]DAQ72038.1 MAG TPA: hypothetical protein [Bacteriophage sp.]